MGHLLRSCGRILLLCILVLPLAPGITAAAGTTFPDVPASASYAEAVQQLLASGVIHGYADGRFGPADAILRAQAAVTIVRAMQFTAQQPQQDFADQGPTDNESWKAVRTLADRGVARGFADGTFQPTGALTRQQALSFISRAMVARGTWVAQSTGASTYPDVASVHNADVTTYQHYVGGVPQATPGKSMGAATVASRGWYAETLWNALKGTRGGSSATLPVPSPAPTAPSPVAAPVTTATPYTFGTLLSDSKNATQLYASGVRVVHLELGWDAYEPTDGVFDASYAAAAAQKLKTFKAVGLQVVLGVGLQYPPSWVFNYPNSRYVDQQGRPAGPVNLTFNTVLRQRAATYVARVDRDLGLNNFVAVRIGSGGLIEAMYPGADAGGGTNSYWAYDANAQGSTGRPATIAANPYPGWRPGQTSYQGQPFSVAQVQRWYDWYLGAMVDGINWQIGIYRQLGFSGDQQVLLPGLGSRPDEYRAAIANYLGGGGDDNHTMGRAAVWNKVIAGLSTRERIVIYISSLADGSGGDDSCAGTDQAVREDDPQVDSWSATRWVSYNANRYGMAKNGENPGRGDTNAYGPKMLQAAVRQMQGCGLQGIMWAHESNLYDSNSGVTVATYGAAIASVGR